MPPTLEETVRIPRSIERIFPESFCSSLYQVFITRTIFIKRLFKDLNNLMIGHCDTKVPAIQPCLPRKFDQNGCITWHTGQPILGGHFWAGKLSSPILSDRVANHCEGFANHVMKWWCGMYYWQVIEICITKPGSGDQERNFQVQAENLSQSKFGPVCIWQLPSWSSQ